jgi:hypothetical protein
MSLPKLEDSLIEKRVIDDEALDLLVEPGSGVELPALGTSQRTGSGYFSDRSAMIKAAAGLSGKTEYCTHRFTRADVAAFGRLGIPPELLAEARVRRVTDLEAREQFGMTGPLTKGMSGIVFPYFSIATGARVTARVRRDNPEIENGKEREKYISASSDRKHLYFPPRAAAKLQQHDTLLVLVEAEKSVLALSAWAERTGTNLLAIGMGGCWGWRGRIGRVTNAHGERVDEKGPVSDLNCCDKRKVYILLDANVATNPNVQQARAALVRELVARDCQTFICALPPREDVNGPDDYIAVCGDEAMAHVFSEARAAIASCAYGGGQFEVGDRGVVYNSPPDKEGNIKPPLWVCARPTCGRHDPRWQEQRMGQAAGMARCGWGAASVGYAVRATTARRWSRSALRAGAARIVHRSRPQGT